MKPVEFLVNALRKISESFPEINIKYGFNEVIQTHVVEFLPAEQYWHNDSLTDNWIPLSFKFRECYPTEDITFISSDSPLAKFNPLFEFNVPVSGIDMISNIYAPLSEQAFNYTFPTHIPKGTVIAENIVERLLDRPKQYLDELPTNEETYYQAAA